MRSTAAARRYARALFALAHEGGAVTRIREELAAIGHAFAEAPELRHALLRPLHPAAERRAVLRDLCQRLGASDTMRKFLAFLVDQRRLVDYEAILEEYERLADAAAGRVRAEVVCASALQSEQLERLRRALSARTGRDVEVDVRIDETLIAGAVAKVGDLVIDGSLRTQLAQLRDSLTRGQ